MSFDYFYGPEDAEQYPPGRGNEPLFHTADEQSRPGGGDHKDGKNIRENERKAIPNKELEGHGRIL